MIYFVILDYGNVRKNKINKKFYLKRKRGKEEMDKILWVVEEMDPLVPT